MTFEQTLSRLEQIAASLDRDDLPLEEALKLFEEGITRLREASAALADADGKPVGSDGVVRRNTLALYSHQHFASCPEVVGYLLAAARQARRDMTSCRTK